MWTKSSFSIFAIVILPLIFFVTADDDIPVPQNNDLVPQELRLYNSTEKFIPDGTAQQNLPKKPLDNGKKAIPSFPLPYGYKPNEDFIPTLTPPSTHFGYPYIA